MQIYYKGRQQKSSIFYAKPDGRHGNSYRRNLFIVAGRNENRADTPVPTRPAGLSSGQNML